MHLSVKNENGTLVLDRKLSPGTGPPTYGLEVCRSLDMDPEFLQAADAIRRHVLNVPELVRKKTSRYNASVLVDRCHLCGAAAEETHHIVPQANVANKASMNRMSNLIALCGACHDAIHRGEKSIEGYVATSEGVMVV